MSKIKELLEDEFYKYTQQVSLHWMEQDFYFAQEKKSDKALQLHQKHNDALRPTVHTTECKPSQGEDNTAGPHEDVQASWRQA